MTTQRQWLVVGAIVVTLGGALLAGTSFVGGEPTLGVGRPLPQVHAFAVDGPQRAVQIGTPSGAVTVLNLWATWCVPCRAEMPSLERLYRVMGPRGLRVVAVSVDDGSANDKIRDFVTEYGLTFTVLHEGSGEIEQRLQTSGVPETFVIGRDGVIRKRVLGATAWDSPSNQALITALLDEPAQ